MGILEVGIIKQAEMKSHQRNKQLSNPHCKILGTILKKDKRGTWINETKHKKIWDNAQGSTSKR